MLFTDRLGSFPRYVPLAAVAALLFLSPTATFAEGRGALVIAGGARLPDAIRDEFIELAGGADEAHIVLLPTASIYADDDDREDRFGSSWRERDLASVTLLHTRDRQAADDPDFAEPLLRATGVWIGGGDQRRLIEAYGGTLVEARMHQLLERGGVIGGTSAGAAVMSNPMITGGAKVAETGPGFGFLKNFIVDQHFVARGRVDRLRSVLTELKEYGGLGVDESTAAVIRGDSLTVRGESTVTAIWPQSSPRAGKEQALSAGEVIEIATLRDAAGGQ